ncbi:MAG: hypothetical protein J6Y37_11860 [Paludibacteraceae bacterium]|nr:hypothetical protein [Paludibacteraceae bacterium]
MAKVISWQIAGKFVYITPQHGSYILDSQISESERTALKNEAKNWNLQAYTTRFQEMYQAVENMWGTTDLNPNASFYYNALQGEGVYMIGGADGVNTADYGKPFYNLVIENNNTSVGLGGDYVLDKRTDLYTKIYLERNGAFFAPPASDISIVDEVGTTTSFSTETVSENGIAKTQIKLTVPANTQFDEDYPIKEYTITVVKGDSYTGKTVFTVVGVKDGEEGASYDLVVKPRQIKVTADGDVSNEAVTCSAVRNGIEVINGNGTKLVDDLNLQIKYDFGTITDDVDDISNVYRGGISYQDIAENGDQVNFYLIFNGRYLVDSDSCTISRDGKDNGTLKLELDNEMDGISVGSDTKLDISEPVTSSTGFVLYSGGTELEILNSGQNKVKVENLGQNASWTVYGSENNTGTSVEGKKKGWIKFTLNDQFDFGEDYKDSVKITVWGQNEHGEIASATTNYLIMGIRGGKDGEVFKIIPNLDVILCDPNNADTPYVGSETHLTAEAYIGTERIENAEITYSLDVTYGNAYTQTAHLPAAGLAIADLITGASPHRYVALYLWTGDTSNPSARILVDRETIPIIWQGANGSAAWVELGNEIDSVSVGWDTDLDLDEELTSVTVGTTVRVISGDTPIQIQDIKIIAPNGKEGHWASFTERSWDWNRREDREDSEEPVNDEDVDNGTHTIARVFITLLDGFDFDEDLREQATIAVTAGTQGNLWYGYAHYVIKGIPGGKDGYVYRLVPEVDFINFHPNEGIQGTLDFGQSNITCAAYYGSILLDPLSDDPEANFGEIYYSFNKICTSTGDTETAGYVTGMTIYPSGGVSLGGSDGIPQLITRNNYTNFKYLVFYLVANGEIIDRETIPIIADGLNAHDSVWVELTNEIDSIGVGDDSKLDLPVGESRVASTGILLYSGDTPLDITSVSGAFSRNSSASPNTYTISSAATVTEIGDLTAATADLLVTLFNGFEFGTDLKEKVVITVYGTNDIGEEAVASATFVIAAIKGGKDGVTYKVKPTPDILLYDMETSQWAGNASSASALAYANGLPMREDGNGYTEGTNYQLKTSEIIMDLDTAGERWSTLINYQEGAPYPFHEPALRGREQTVAFYLAVKLDGSNNWTVVDRETVSLHISGKDGVDGTSSPSFDLTNLIEVITTGTNNVLDVSGYKYYYTTVRGRMGTRNVPIKVTTATSPYSQCRVTTGSSSDNTVQVTVRLGDGFDFTSEQIRKFTINASFESDSSISDTLTFTLKSIQQPDVPEGESYKLRTNVPEVVITGNDYNPETIQAGVYLGKTQKACTIYTKYVSKDDQELTLSQIMTKSTYGNTGTGTTTNPATISVSAVQGIAPNGLLYIAAFDGDDFLDAEDIPVLAGGGSSGVIADLSDDVGVVATGDNERLEANVVGQLSTKAFIYDGHTPLPLQSVVLPNNGSNITTYGGKIKFSLSGFTAGSTQAIINVDISASTADFVDFATSNPLQFDIVLNAQVEQGEEPIQRTVGYSLLGLRAGKDGDTIHLELNCDQVFHGDTGFDPQEIKCKLYFGGVDITDESDGANPTLRFLIKNSDMDDADNTELWLDKFNAEYRSGYYVFPLTEEYTSEYSPLTIRAERNIKKNASDPDNWVLMDWETVQVLRNGNDGVGGIELKLDQPNYEIEQVDSDKVVTEDVSARTYVSLHSGNTTLNISQIEWLQSQSSYGNGVTFTTGYEQGEPWIMVGIPQGYDFSVNSPTQIRVSATGGTGSDAISRKATFVITEKLGGKGDRGPKTRLTEWSGSSISYQDGKNNDDYWDIVYYIQRDNQDNVVFAGYFGCKKDNTSNDLFHPNANANRPKLKLVDDEYVWDDTDEYWEYYEDYDFIASKVATFGDGLDGWVIDRGKIQHTSSSVTLNADGIIEVANTGTTYYKYSGAGMVLYAKQDFTNSTMFNENFGSKVPLYSASTTNGVKTYYAYTYDFSLSGTSSNPTMVKETSNKVNNKLYMYGTPNSFTYALDYSINESIVINPTVRVYKIDVWYHASDGTYYGKAYSATTQQSSTFSPGTTRSAASITPTFPGTPYAQILPENGESTTAEVIAQLKPTQFLSAYALGRVDVVPACDSDQEGSCNMYCSVDEVDIIDIDCPKDSVIAPEVDYIATTKYYYNFTNIGVVVGGVSGDYTSHLYTDPSVECNVWFDATATKNGYSSVENVKFNSTYTNVNAPVSPVVTTLSYVNAEPNGSTTVAVINGTNNGSSEMYGDIVIAAGFENIKYVYKWGNGSGSYIYTIYPYNTSMFGLIDGDAISVYDDLNTPIDLTAYIFEGSNSNSIYYLNSSFTYVTAVTVSDKTKFANTRIYSDGAIVTNKLVATDGKFSGYINATGGEFNGKVHINEGDIDSVKITNGDFSGNVNLVGENILSFRQSENGEPTIILSNTDIQISQGNYTIPFTNTYTIKAYGQESLHWTTGYDSKTIFTASVSSGSTVMIPQVTLRTSFERKVVTATVSYRVYFNGTTQYNRNFTYSDTSDSQTATVSTPSATVSADTLVKIEMYMSYTLQSTFWGTTSISYSVISYNGVTIKQPDGTIAKQFRVGPNGFAYNDGNGGNMSIVRTNSGTTVSAYVGVVNQGQPQPWYGIIADSDELYLVVGGNKFKAEVTTSGQNKILSWLYKA